MSGPVLGVADLVGIDGAVSQLVEGHRDARDRASRAVPLGVNRERRRVIRPPSRVTQPDSGPVPDLTHPTEHGFCRRGLIGGRTAPVSQMTLTATLRSGASFNPPSTVRTSLRMRLLTGRRTRSHHASDSFAAARGALNMLWASPVGSSSASRGRPCSTVTVVADIPHHLCACAMNIHLNGLPVASGLGYVAASRPPNCPESAPDSRRTSMRLTTGRRAKS